MFVADIPLWKGSHAISVRDLGLEIRYNISEKGKWVNICWTTSNN